MFHLFGCHGYPLFIQYIDNGRHATIATAIQYKWSAGQWYRCLGGGHGTFGLATTKYEWTYPVGITESDQTVAIDEIQTGVSTVTFLHDLCHGGKNSILHRLCFITVTVVAGDHRRVSFGNMHVSCLLCQLLGK